jgi:hypothetical protein
VECVSDLITRTARLVPYTKRPKHLPGFVTAYAYEPMPDDPGIELGNLYVVIEVLVSGRASEEVADLVIETAGNQYYNKAQPQEGALERFESAIKAVNQELTDHVNRGNAAWIGKLSAVIAVHCGSEVHLAQTGSAEAFLYRGKTSTQVTAGAPSRAHNPSKTFGSIASGQLEAGDRLLLSTPALIHQVPLTKLRGIIGQSGPNAAISEITELLKDASVERIAALIIEITTPELAAVQVRSDQPSEIRLGSPENPLQAAKMAATPIAVSTITSSQKLAHSAGATWKRAKPGANAIIQTASGKAKTVLSSRRNRLILVGSGVAAVLISGFSIWHSRADLSATKAFSEYQSAYNSYVSAQNHLAAGDSQTSTSEFSSASKTLANLKPKKAVINNKLANSDIPSGEPKTFDDFSKMLVAIAVPSTNIQDSSAKVVAKSTSKTESYSHFELAGASAYAITSGSNPSIKIVNIKNGDVTNSTTNTTRLGTVVGTALSSNSDGMYILTAKPGVWFYHFGSDTLTEQTVNLGSWPKATAIASYLSNIYLLGDNVIYKHTKSASGFSPKNEYITTTKPTDKDPIAMAVDGSIYLMTASGLDRFTAGSLKQTLPAPEGLTGATIIRSTTGGSVIVGLDPKTKFIGLWTATDKAVTFKKQVSIKDAKEIADATYDPQTHDLYALADGKLVKLPVSL